MGSLYERFERFLDATVEILRCGNSLQKGLVIVAMTLVYFTCGFVVGLGMSEHIALWGEHTSSSGNTAAWMAAWPVIILFRIIAWLFLALVSVVVFLVLSLPAIAAGIFGLIAAFYFLSVIFGAAFWRKFLELRENNEKRRKERMQQDEELSRYLFGSNREDREDNVV